MTGATASRWDAERAKKRRAASAGLPICRRCRLVSVLDPCRDCATPEELRSTRKATSRGESVDVPNYPELPERYL